MLQNSGWRAAKHDKRFANAGGEDQRRRRGFLCPGETHDDQAVTEYFLKGRDIVPPKGGAYRTLIAREHKNRPDPI